jgi:hypothetical protein
MVRKGIINNDGHPNYEWNDERMAALECWTGMMVAMFSDCSNACMNP